MSRSLLLAQYLVPFIPYLSHLTIRSPFDPQTLSVLLPLLLSMGLPRTPLPPPLHPYILLLLLFTLWSLDPRHTLSDRDSFGMVPFGGLLHKLTIPPLLLYLMILPV